MKVMRTVTVYSVYCVCFIANLSTAEGCDNTTMLPMEEASHDDVGNKGTINH